MPRSAVTKTLRATVGGRDFDHARGHDHDCHGHGHGNGHGYCHNRDMLMMTKITRAIVMETVMVMIIGVSKCFSLKY